MPADGGAVLGSSVNRWYRNGLATSVRYVLPPDGPEIQLLDAPHFVATKLEAMHERATDKRWSQDWEDIIYVLETRHEFVSELRQAPAALRQFVAGSFAELISDPEMNEWLEAVRDPESSLSLFMMSLHCSRQKDTIILLYTKYRT